MKGVYFNLVPFFVIFSLCFLIFAYDLTIIYFSSKELKNLANEVAETALKAWVQVKNRNDLTDRLNLVQTAVLQAVTHRNLFFLSKKVNSPISVNVGFDSNHSASSDINVTIGVYTPNGFQRPSFTRSSREDLVCRQPRGCFEPILNENNSIHGNAVSVTVNRNRALEPFTFVWRLLNDSTPLEGRAVAATRPRVVFNLIDFSPSTFEGQGGFSRRGRWRSLPFFELENPNSLVNWDYCEPTLTRREGSPRLNFTSNCTFRGIGERIWNAPKYSMPVSDRYSNAFEMIRSDLKYYRQSAQHDNPDYNVWIVWDKRLHSEDSPSPANDWLFRIFVFWYRLVNQINAAQNVVSLATHEKGDETSQNRTPRLFWHDNAVYKAKVLAELGSAVYGEYFDHQYLRPTSYDNYNLSGIYSTPLFQWNANQDYRNFWFNNSAFEGHFNLLAFEVKKDNPSTILDNILWPVFFMGVIRPGAGKPQDYHSAHFKLTGRQAEPNSPFVLRSPDGAIYREHSMSKVVSTRTCCVLNTNTVPNQILCAKVLSGKVGLLQSDSSDSNNQTSVTNVVDFDFCPIDKSTGSLIWWPDGNWDNIKERTIIKQNEQSTISLCGSSSASPTRPCLCGTELEPVGNSFWIKGCNQFNPNYVYWLNFLNSPVEAQGPPRITTDVHLWFNAPSRWWLLDPYNRGESRITKIPVLVRDNGAVELSSDINHEQYSGKVVMYPVYTSYPPNNNTWQDHINYFSGLREYLERNNCTFSGENSSSGMKACYVVRADYSNFFDLSSSQHGEKEVIKSHTRAEFLSRAVNFLRYMSDYKPVTVQDLKLIKHDISQDNHKLYLSEGRSEPNFNLLVEDPKFLRERKFLPTNQESVTVQNQGSDYCPRICPSNVPTSPSACPYQLGFHPFVTNRLRATGGNNTTSSCFVYQNPSRNEGWSTSFREADIPKDASLFRMEKVSYTTNDRPIVHVFWPDFYFEDYVGPQPFSDIARGVAHTYRLLSDQFRVPGDQFGMLPFASGLGFYNSFIPLTGVEVPSRTIESGNCSSLENNQRKLCGVLHAMWPDQNFGDFNKLSSRYQLGMFPSSAINQFETNLVWALAAAGLYLRDIAVTHRVYLPVFSDLLALGSCNLGTINNSNLTWQNLLNCVQNRIDRRDSVLQNRNVFESWFNEVMTVLTGENYLSPTDRSRVHQGLIRFLAENNIIPIFFVLNGTAGGVPLTPHPNSSSGCIYDRKQLIANGRPTAFRSEVDRLFGRQVGAIIDVAKNSGHFGNAYIYALGDLEPILQEVGGDFVQLLPTCKVRPGSRTALDRLLGNEVLGNEGYCALARKNNLNPSFPTHYSGGDTDHGICGHLLRYPKRWGAHGWSFSSFPTPAHTIGSCMNFETARGSLGSYWGFSFTNLGLDFGIIPPAWRMDMWKVDNEWYTYPLNPFLFVGRHVNFFLHFMPHIDISVAGGLRCHPEKTIFQQIQEVFEAILRNPDVLIFDSVPELRQGPQTLSGGPITLP